MNIARQKLAASQRLFFWRHLPALFRFLLRCQALESPDHLRFRAPSDHLHSSFYAAENDPAFAGTATKSSSEDLGVH